MAPEQLVSSRDVDPRTDVWALGVVLYTLLAGKPPFDGKTLRVLYEQILKQPPPPITRPLPQGLAAIIDRCLRKPPEQRFADARALAVALAPFAKRRGSRRATYLVMAVGVLASIGVSASIMAIDRHRDRTPALVETAGVPSASAPTASAPTANTRTTSEPTASATAASATSARGVVEPPQRIVSVDPSAKPVADDNDDMPRNVQLLVAEKYANAFCSHPHVRECLTTTFEACATAVRHFHVECRRSGDRADCITQKVNDHFAAAFVHSDACLLNPAE